MKAGVTAGRRHSVNHIVALKAFIQTMNQLAIIDCFDRPIRLQQLHSFTSRQLSGCRVGHDVAEIASMPVNAALHSRLPEIEAIDSSKTVLAGALNGVCLLIQS